MNRYHIVKEMLYHELEEKSHGYYKMLAYEHLFQVSTLCITLSIEKNLNKELAAIMGVFHDCSTYINQSSFDHANKSSLICRRILEESKEFEEDEIFLIVRAIKNHSNKDRIDDDYSELLKQADCLSHDYLK